MELAAPPPPRSPWQRLYAAAHRLRRTWWRDRAERLPRPVVSVGNLHWGGAGKTPLTAAVARHLRDGGRRVCVLSRGYGRSGSGVRLVSDGGPPRLGAEEAGDEPVLLAGELPGVAVVVGARRAEAGRRALEELEPAPDLFVLDDGFSHLALARDLDLLAFPAADPFAGGRLLPSGRLREPLAAAERAHAAVLTGLAPEEMGTDETGDGTTTGNALATALEPHGFRGRGFASALAAAEPRLLDGAPLVAGTPVLLVSAIARPERFARSARRAGVTVAGELEFPDHHPYPERSLERIRRHARKAGAGAVLVTSKDRVKLAGRLDLPLAELPVRAEPEAAFWRWLDRRLATLGAAGEGRS